ncbi:MAG: anti-sigma factor [Mycobacteriaceae bacterium]|nr:anti-sigma factor [Mycobacteriaceae bacterium]MBV9516421.1 anti-sigma factor [Mycobacteriaceae bacterium]
MSEPTDFDLLELATPYALDAVTDDERATIDRRVATAPAAMAEAFHREVQAVRETMSVVSASTAADPPAELRTRILAATAASIRRRSPWRTTLLAAAAAVIIGLGAVSVGWALYPEHRPSTAEQVFAAPDVHTVSSQIPGGGSATVIFSREKNAGVLVMNDVPPPKSGTVYQMWLINDRGPSSAGTMDAKAVAPSTTAVLPDLRHSTALAFTVEPDSGSTEPTTPIIAQLPLM